MTKGITTELPELIDLQRYAHLSNTRSSGRALQAGGYLSRWHGRGMDFSEVRNYQAGDEIRHMDWRVTARTGKPHIKLYQEERERPVIILTDFNPSMYFGTRIAFKSVVAARLSALLAWTVVKQGDRVGALLFSETTHNEFSPRARQAGVLPILEGLSTYTNVARVKPGFHPGYVDDKSFRPMSDVLHRIRRVIKPGSILVIISDFYHLDDESQPHLHRLSLQNSVLAYHVCDPLELAPPKPQHYVMTNGQKDLFLDTTQRAVRDEYTLACEQRLTSLQLQLKGLRIAYTQVTPEHDLPLLVRQTFPRRSHG